jgi:thiol:disulfide interchange protein DsbA|tara:strand:- start:7115 stop:7756 length:642 start_codon:yes stop_codon:yes gene_type:complete
MKPGLVVSLFIMFVTPLVSLGESSPQYEEGTHYIELTIAIRSRNPNKIEVTEYFSYGCPHCYQLDPIVESWKRNLASDVDFNRTPAMWNKDYQVYAQTYYAAEAMGVIDKIHTALFKAIHDERRRLTDPQAMAMFFGEFDIDPINFAKVYQSFGVRASVQQAEARGRAYRASGVPAFIVNGKYRVDSTQYIDHVEMLKIVSFLVAKERSAKVG